MSRYLKKYKWLIILEAVLLLIAATGLFRKEELVYQANGEEIAAAISVEGESALYRSGNFRLTPGVYQVRAIASIQEEEASVYLEPVSEKVTFRSMSCNGVTVFYGQENCSFEIYVLDTQEEVHLAATYEYGSEQPVLVEYALYRTNYGSRMLLVILVGVFTALNLLLGFRQRILAGEVSRQRQVAFWVLLGAVLLAYLPYATDYINLGADTTFHLSRIEGLQRTLRQGEQFPVRVQSYWLYDHGYATSSFYGDLFLLFPAFLRIMGFTMMTSYKAFILLTLVVSAALIFICFEKCVHHIYASLFGSLLYLLVPYRIFNYYNRGALGEYLAMVFFPLIFYGMYRIYTEDPEGKAYKHAKWSLVIGLTCLLQSHLLSTEMAAGFILLICIVYWRRTLRRKTFLQLAEAAGITLLLNAWFWIPLLHMMSADDYLLGTIVSKSIQSEGARLSDAVLLFVRGGDTEAGMYLDGAFQMGAALLLVLLVFAFCAWWGRKVWNRTLCYRSACVCWILALVCGVLSTGYFPWDLLSRIPGVGFLVRTLQFPTRMLAPGSFFACGCAVFGVRWLAENMKEKQLGGYLKAGVLSLAVLAVFSAAFQVNSIAYQMKPTFLYNMENIGTRHVAVGEYMLEGTDQLDYYYHDPVATKGLRWSDYKKNGTEIIIRVENTSETEQYLELPLIGYRGYRVEAQTQGDTEPYITEERGEHGDLRIAVPADYQGELQIGYWGHWSYRVAEWISVGTILVLAVLSIAALHSRKKGDSNE